MTRVMSIFAEIIWNVFAPVDPRLIGMILRLQFVPTMLASQASYEQAIVEKIKETRFTSFTE